MQRTSKVLALAAAMSFLEIGGYYSAAHSSGKSVPRDYDEHVI